jgi:hypothetical protein
MPAKISPWIWITALLILWLGPAVVAQDDALLAPTTQHIAAVKNNLIPQWRSSARMYEVLSWIVFGLGLVTTATQLPQLAGRSGTKVAVAVIGLVVSGLTGWLEKGFPCDHRAYRRAIVRAEKAISDLETQMVIYKEHPDLPRDFQAKLQFIKTNLAPLDNELRDLEAQLVAVSWPLGARPVYAAEAGLLTVVGVGESNSLFQAQENSYYAAVEQMVTALGRPAGLQLTPADRAMVQGYIAAYATKTQLQRPGSTAGSLRYETRLALNPIYANAYAIRAFLDSERVRQGPRPLREQIIQAVRKSAAAGKLGRDADGFLEAGLRAPLKGGPLERQVLLEAKNPKFGSFLFTFTIARESKGAARVTLRSIDIREDASGGSTRWSFDVLSQGRVIFSLAEQRWDDSRRPTRCVYAADAGYSGAAPLAGDEVEITLVGLKPKVLP